MIPKLPTDNLYKFLAIGGIILWVFIGWVDIQQRIDMQKTLFEARYEANDFIARYNNFLDSLGLKTGVACTTLPDFARKILTNKNEYNSFLGDDRDLFLKSFDIFDDLLISIMKGETKSTEVESERRSETAKDLRIKLRHYASTVENFWYLVDKEKVIWRELEINLRSTSNDNIGVCPLVLPYSTSKRQTNETANCQI